MWSVRRKSELLRMTHNKHPSRLANDNKLFKSQITKTTDNFHMIKWYAQTISHTQMRTWLNVQYIYIYTPSGTLSHSYAKSPWNSWVNLAYSFVGHSFHFPKWSGEDNPIFNSHLPQPAFIRHMTYEYIWVAADDVWYITQLTGWSYLVLQSGSVFWVLTLFF